MSEVDPQNRYAEFRAHKEMRRWKQAWEASKIILHPELKEAAIKEWWRVADLDEVARLIEWSHDGDDYRWAAGWCDTFTSYKKWRVHLGENLIIQRKHLDIVFEQRKFARKPAEHVRHIWEDWANQHCKRFEFVASEALEINELNCDKLVVTRALSRIKVAARTALESGREGGGHKASFAVLAAGGYASGFVKKGEARKDALSSASWNATFAIKEGFSEDDWKLMDIPDFKHMFNVHLLNVVKIQTLMG